MREPSGRARTIERTSVGGPTRARSGTTAGRTRVADITQRAHPTDAAAGTRAADGVAMAGSVRAAAATSRGDRATVDRDEVEWQFEARDPHAVRRWLRAARFAPALEVGAPTVDTIEDTYFDTEDWRLYRAGYALRVRRVADRVEATMKSCGKAASGPERRREITAPLPIRDGGAELFRNVAGPLGVRISLVAGRRPLRRVVALRTRRERFPLTHGNRAVAELAIDQTNVDGRALPRGRQTSPGRQVDRQVSPDREVSPGRQAPASPPAAVLRRVEVELQGAPAVAIEPFVEALRTACALERAEGSKYEAALGKAGITPEPVPDLGPTAIDDTMSIGAVAFAFLRRNFAVLLNAEPGTRLGEDAEALHDMRVATRTLRTAIKLFDEALPRRVVGLRDTLGWLGEALGAVRDLDVQLEQLREWRAEMDPAAEEALEAVAAALRRRRLTARVRMLRALDARRYEAFVGRVTALLRRGPTQGSAFARRSVLAVAPELITRRYRKLKKCGDSLAASSTPAEYHRARIQAKRLRYALDAHGDIYGKPLRRFLRAVVALQRLLGHHQDAEVAAGHLRALCTEHRPVPRREAVFVIGGLAERYTSTAAGLRQRFPKRYRCVRGRHWKRLRKAMDERRPAEPTRASKRSTP